jgi:hypothetical protein
LAPLATAATPSFQQQPAQPQTFTNYQQPQQQGQFFYPPAPQNNNFNGQQQPPQFQQQQPQFQQPNTFNPNGNFYNPYANNTSNYNREPPVINYTFKEGTPPYCKSSFVGLLF